jgi:hypothetical protein
LQPGARGRSHIEKSNMWSGYRLRASRMKLFAKLLLKGVEVVIFF